MDQQAFANADAEWLELIRQARKWMGSPRGQLLLSEEQQLLEPVLNKMFGSYLIHYAALPTPIEASKIRYSIRLGAPLSGVDIACEEYAWPIEDNSVDVVLLQHGLDFSLCPYALLREAARCVRPGGQLLITGINPRSLWGLRRLITRDGLQQSQSFAPGRVADWLSVLGFALENRRFGCYRPPFASTKWQARLKFLEHWGQSGLWPFPAALYVLTARKLAMGLRPLQDVRHERRSGQLISLPVAKVSPRQNQKIR